jgi:hypothetical protein
MRMLKAVSRIGGLSAFDCTAFPFSSPTTRLDRLPPLPAPAASPFPAAAHAEGHVRPAGDGETRPAAFAGFGRDRVQGGMRGGGSDCGARVTTGMMTATFGERPTTASQQTKLSIMTKKSLAQRHGESAKRLMKLLMKEERLLPGLQRYVECSDTFGPIFRHPLCVQVRFNMDRAAWINWTVPRREKELERLRRKGDWMGAISLYHVSFLLHGFIKDVEHFDDASYWNLLAHVWTSIESPWRDRRLLLAMFQSPRPERNKLMNKSEHQALARLPESFPVYRGFLGRRAKGLSWTTDRKRAIWFARRFAKIGIGDPRPLSGIAAKKDVLAYFARRKESEVVIDPEKVKERKVQML